MANNEIAAYHGTTKAKARSILTSNTFYSSTKSTDWLGSGVYFFAYKGHAVDWANTEASKSKYYTNEPAILCAKLSFLDEQLLDLDDPIQMRKFIDVVMCALKEATPHVDADLHRMERWRQWCLACNVYRKLYPAIGITVLTFYLGKNDIFQNNQRQICVSKHSIITSIEQEA